MNNTVGILSAGIGSILASILIATSAIAAPITIDAFDTSQSVTQNGVGVSAESVVGPGILGDERDVILTVTLDDDGPGGVNQAQFTANDGGNSLGNYINDADVQSDLELQYDGIDGSSALNASGLGGIDLTDGGSNDGISMEIEFSDLPVATTISVYTDAGNYSSIDVVSPGAIFTTQAFFIPFASFVTQAGSGADFTSAGAVTFLFDGPPGLDFRFDFVGATEEVPEPAGPFLMGLGVLSLGAFAARRRRMKK